MSLIIVTRYAQKNKTSKLCKRHTFKRGKIDSVDIKPIPESTLNELLKEKNNIHFVNVEKLSDLDLKSLD